MPKRVEIVRRGVLKQKWYGRFVGDNNLKLAGTIEHYHNLGDLKAMLQKYYPDWPVTFSKKAKADG